jgi:hypothetical protein
MSYTPLKPTTKLSTSVLTDNDRILAILMQRYTEGEYKGQYKYPELIKFMTLVAQNAKEINRIIDDNIKIIDKFISEIKKKSFQDTLFKEGWEEWIDNIQEDIVLDDFFKEIVDVRKILGKRRLLELHDSLEIKPTKDVTKKTKKEWKFTASFPALISFISYILDFDTIIKIITLDFKNYKGNNLQLDIFKVVSILTVIYFVLRNVNLNKAILPFNAPIELVDETPKFKKSKKRSKKRSKSRSKKRSKSRTKKQSK